MFCFAKRAPGDLRDVGVLGRQHAVERLEQAAPRCPCGRRRRRSRRRTRPRRRTASVCGSSLERPRLLGADHAAAELGAGDRASATEPVARIDRLRLVLRRRRRATFASRVTEPTPSITSTLFFFIRPATPPVSVLMTFGGARRPRRSRSSGSGTLMPNSAASSISRDDVRDAQHRLGRDAGVVEAAPADLVLLHDGGLHAELGRADRRHVPARPGTDDDAVVSALRHGGAEASRRGSRGAAPGAGSGPSTRIRNQNSGPATAMIAEAERAPRRGSTATSRLSDGEDDRDRRAAPRSRAPPSSAAATCRRPRRASARRRSATPAVDGLLRRRPRSRRRAATRLATAMSSGERDRRAAARAGARRARAARAPRGRRRRARAARVAARHPVVGASRPARPARGSALGCAATGTSSALAQRARRGLRVGGLGDRAHDDDPASRRARRPRATLPRRARRSRTTACATCAAAHAT